MKIPFLVSLALAAAWPCSAGAQQSIQLTRTALGSAGGTISGSSLSLGMTVGQSVTGVAAGPRDSPPKTFAETVGFWIWGRLPVLGIEDLGGGDGISGFQLFNGAPNPFGRQSVIHYAIPATAVVSLRLYDISGRLVRVLESGLRPAGLHTTSWDGLNESGEYVGSGIYFCRMEAEGFHATRRLALTR